MHKIVIGIIALVFIAAGAAVFYFTHHSTSENLPLPADAHPVAIETGDDTPVTVAFELNDLDNNKRDFAEWDGKLRIVNFWATWCAPCRREIPLLKAFQVEHGADGFQVIGIAVEFLEPVVAYAEAAEFNYPILYGELDAMEVAESSGISFVGLPFTMVVARDGTLVGAHIGEIHQQHLDNIVAVLGQLDRGEVDVPGARAALDLM